MFSLVWTVLKHLHKWSEISESKQPYVISQLLFRGLFRNKWMLKTKLQCKNRFIQFAHNIVMTKTLKKHEIIVSNCSILQRWEETLMFCSDCCFCITISPDSLAWSPAWNFHWHLLNNKPLCKRGSGCCFLHWVTHQSDEGVGSRFPCSRRRLSWRFVLAGVGGQT